jgi:cation:H+ antiporter
MGSLLKPSTALFGRINPASIGIVVVWAVGIFVINRAGKNPRWKIEMPGSRPGRRRHERAHPAEPHPFSSWTTARVAGLFALASAVTLGAGVVLAQSGNALANRMGVNGVVFGATVLAAATALPEISSGVAAVALGDHALAMGDILGGNAFQVCLFLLADLVAGQPVLQSAGPQNALLAALGIALTAIYGFGVIIRPDRCRARLGPDSIVALIVFAIGITALFFVTPI